MMIEAPENCSERVAAFATRAWLAGQVSQAFNNPQGSDFKEIMQHIFERDGFNSVAIALFNGKNCSFNTISGKAMEAMFYLRKDFIDLTFGHRFDWPAYEYVANPSVIDEE